MSVRLSVRMEQLDSRWTDFREICYLSTFRKSIETTQVSLNSDKNNGTLYEARYTFLIIPRSVLRMENVSRKSCVGNQNTHFVFSNFLSKIVSLSDDVEKYCRAGQAT
jgi:hypothetical protein